MPTPPHPQARSGAQALRPSRALAPFVDHYWFGSGRDAAVATLRPDGRVDAVLAHGARGAALSVHGSVTVRTELALQADALYLGIQFRAGQARHFLHVPTPLLTDGALPGEDAFAPALPRLLDLSDPLAAVRAVEAALLQHLGRTPPRASRADALVARIEATRGAERIESLADRFGIGRRQVERCVLEAVGLTPKAFASIERFNHAAACLRAGLPPAQAAFDAGYADQSHLHQAFRRYAATTPARYARGEVAFLQDGKRVPHDHAGHRNPCPI